MTNPMKADGRASRRMIHRRIPVLCTILLVFTSSGCIGILPTRELLENIRGPPSDDVVLEAHQVNHTFTSFNPAESYFSQSLPISVDEDARSLRLAFQVHMDFQEFENQTSDFRYVSYRLLNPDGSPQWEENATHSMSPGQKSLLDPSPGNWTLEVTARGYGFSVGGIIESNDRFNLVVTIESVELVHADET